MTHFRLITEIAAPPETCFDLVLNVDVQRSLGGGMEAVAGVMSGALHAGEEVTWRARHFGVLWLMTSKIVEVERPHHFYDEMRRGPFQSWRHQHQFLPTAWGTRMVDEVEYSAPLGLLGWIADALVLRAYMARLLTRRNRDLKVLAEHEAAGGSRLFADMSSCRRMTCPGYDHGSFMT